MVVNSFNAMVKIKKLPLLIAVESTVLTEVGLYDRT